MIGFGWLKHGFYAKEPLVPGEDIDDFYRHGAEIVGNGKSGEAEEVVDPNDTQ